jgi:hypothetical protein
MARYAWRTVGGKISLKAAGFGELRSRDLDREFGTIQEFIRFAMEELEREARELNQVSEDLLQSGRALRAFLARKVSWLDPAALRREADEMFEEVDLLSSFITLYEKGDERASIPVSMAQYDTRPPKKKNPVGRPRKNSTGYPTWMSDKDIQEIEAAKREGRTPFEDDLEDIPVEKPPMPKFDDTDPYETIFK